MKKIVKTPIVTSRNDMTLSLPTTVHIELTSSCCFTCRHCYNFWRKEKTKPVFMQQKQLDAILDGLIENGIMHIIFTGGEPLLNTGVLLHGIKRLKEAGMSSSCNSTLAVMSSPDEMKKLRDAGLEHILTSLNSCREESNDYLVDIKGAHKRIVNGIKNAVSAGIRISVNMIISETNIKDIYKTAELAHKLGAKKFFGTRVVPHISRGIEKQKEFLIYREEARFIIKELLRVQDDFSMQVGTLVPFPYCLIFEEEDIRRFAGFYSHGCPAGNKMISLNADGNAHACVHEKESYGNIFEIGIKGVWENMRQWRSGEYFPHVCKECHLFDECNGGCRLAALAYKGNIASLDNLRQGWDNKSKKPFQHSEPDSEIMNQKYTVSQSLRFKKDKDFYVIDRFGSEILCIKNDIAQILLNYKAKETALSPHEAGLNDIDAVRMLYKEKLLIPVS